MGADAVAGARTRLSAIRTLGPTQTPGRTAVVLSVVAMGIEPVWRTIFLGQINLVLMALVVVDVLVLRGRRYGGILTGVAAAVKLTPLVFLAISAWMMVHIIRDKPSESLAGLYTLLAGLVLYFISPKARPESPTTNDT